MDCSLPGSSAHEIVQARIQEWVVISFCRGSSPPWDPMCISYTAGGFFTSWATGEARILLIQLTTKQLEAITGMDSEHSDIWGWILANVCVSSVVTCSVRNGSHLGVRWHYLVQNLQNQFLSRTSHISTVPSGKLQLLNRSTTKELSIAQPWVSSTQIPSVFAAKC